MICITHYILNIVIGSKNGASFHFVSFIRLFLNEKTL